jgi:hypothetical protein
MRFTSPGARVDSSFYYKNYSRVDSEQLVLNVESIDSSTVYMTSSVGALSRKTGQAILYGPVFESLLAA